MGNLSSRPTCRKSNAKIWLLTFDLQQRFKQVSVGWTKQSEKVRGDSDFSSKRLIPLPFDHSRNHKYSCIIGVCDRANHELIRFVPVNPPHVCCFSTCKIARSRV